MHNFILSQRSKFYIRGKILGMTIHFKKDENYDPNFKSSH